EYNARCQEAIHAFTGDANSVAIIGKGRNAREQSLVLVERGKYLGFGFLDRKAPVEDFDFVRKAISPGVETPTVQNLVNSYMLNPRSEHLLVYCTPSEIQPPITAY